MKYQTKVFLLLLFHISILSSAQNVIPNASFEFVSPLCGIYSHSDFNNTVSNWISPNEGSPDIFHSSLNTSCPNAAVGSTASNSWGSEIPRTGSSMAAVITYCSRCASETREYLQAELTTPLTPGLTYTASMWVSLGDHCDHKTNNLGMYFSVAPPNSNNWLHLPYTPQVIETNIISETNGWVKVSGSFTATDAAKYITIGNFSDDQSTSIVNTGLNLNSYAVYFVDDVQISTVAITGDTILCSSDSTVLTSQLSTQHNWEEAFNPGISISTDASIIVKPTVTTTYIHFGNSDTASITVHLVNTPTINLGRDTILCMGETMILRSTEGMNNLWSTGASDLSILVSSPGIYWLQVINEHCPGVDSVLIEYTTCNAEIEFPNVITANDDGSNDVFLPFKYENVKTARLHIYNRWGVQLFYTEDLLLGWNGQYNGKVCADGTYFWIVNYTTLQDDPGVLKGTLTLVK